MNALLFRLVLSAPLPFQAQIWLHYHQFPGRALYARTTEFTASSAAAWSG